MKHLFDKHVFIGLSAMTVTGCITAYTAIMGAIAATATAGYMCIRLAIKWREWQRSEKGLDRKAVLTDSEDV